MKELKELDDILTDLSLRCSVLEHLLREIIARCPQVSTSMRWFLDHNSRRDPERRSIEALLNSINKKGGDK